MSVESLMAYDLEHPEHAGTGREEKLLYYSIIRLMRPRDVIETGVSVGHASCWIALAMKDNELGLLKSVDDWSRTHGGQGADESQALKRLTDNGLEGRVKLIQADSLKFLKGQQDKSHDIVLLDDNHDREHVIKELAEAERIAKQLIIVHDTNQPKFSGPKEACKKMGGGVWFNHRRGIWIKDVNEKFLSDGKQAEPIATKELPAEEKKATKTS